MLFLFPITVLAHMTLNKHSWSIRSFKYYFIVNALGKHSILITHFKVFKVMLF